LAVRSQRRATVGGARYGGAAEGVEVPMEAGGGSRCTGPKGRAVRAGFGGSAGETKMGRKLRRLQHKLFLFLNFKQNFRFKNQRFEILLN
jgi:hypothetical protein